MSCEPPLKVGQLNRIGVQVAFEGCATHARVSFAWYVVAGDELLYCCIEYTASLHSLTLAGNGVGVWSGVP